MKDSYLAQFYGKSQNYTDIPNKWYKEYNVKKGLRNEDGWFYSVHMGWWKDEEEPFSAQWKCVAERLARKKNQLTERQGLWLMGDFNSPASVRGEGYDRERMVRHLSACKTPGQGEHSFRWN